MIDKEILSAIKLINSKLDKIMNHLDAMNVPLNKKQKTKKIKPRPEPLTESDVARFKKEFNELFKMWDSGNELDVRERLEGYDVVTLRNFADANNLNVSSKTTKQKILLLISVRFREKRQLLK